MSTTKIADKTTLDNIKTDTTSLLSRGGAKSDGNGGLLVYNPSTNTWDTISGGGGSNNCILTIVNTDMKFTGANITISNLSGLFQTTIIMPDENSVSVNLPYIDTYLIEEDKYNLNCYVEIDKLGSVVINMLDYLDIHAFNDDSSWEDINKMLYYYYSGVIDNLSDFWAVGDTKTVRLAAMTTGAGSIESHAEQDVIFAIADFDHDDLVTPINDKTKAAVTLTQANCLQELGPMNKTNTNSNSWDGSARRTWCNNSYYNSLPLELIPLIKQVNILTAQTYNGKINKISTDYCFLNAIKEIKGGSTQSSASTSSSGTAYSNLYEYNALTQYPYYVSMANKVKSTSTSYGSTSSTYWTRSPTYNASTAFCDVYASTVYNSYGSTVASKYIGIAPCICL